MQPELTFLYRRPSGSGYWPRHFGTDKFGVVLWDGFDLPEGPWCYAWPLRNLPEYPDS
jgi:hypothetical protein